MTAQSTLHCHKGLCFATWLLCLSLGKSVKSCCDFFYMTSYDKHKDTAAKNTTGCSAMWHNVWFICQRSPETTSWCITWLNMCKHKPTRSLWSIGPLSWWFILHPVCGLFVSCFHAWQLWHRFLPSWPCSLKCNKSCIPRLCCTSIGVLLVADKWSRSPWDGRKTGRQQRPLSTGSKVEVSEAQCFLSSELIARLCWPQTPSMTHEASLLSSQREQAFACGAKDWLGGGSRKDTFSMWWYGARIPNQRGAHKTKSTNCDTRHKCST